jgi:hypothetical protein
VRHKDRVCSRIFPGDWLVHAKNAIVDEHR